MAEIRTPLRAAFSLDIIRDRLDEDELKVFELLDADDLSQCLRTVDVFCLRKETDLQMVLDINMFYDKDKAYELVKDRLNAMEENDSILEGDLDDL